MSKKKISLASSIAPEDIRRGVYVAVLHEIDQFYPCWFGDVSSSKEPVNIRVLPANEPEPLKVLEVCLPFVTAQRADRSLVTIDVRRRELARLDDGYARRVIKLTRAHRARIASKDAT